jgi:hypothetical protein
VAQSKNIVVRQFGRECDLTGAFFAATGDRRYGAKFRHPHRRGHRECLFVLCFFVFDVALSMVFVANGERKQPHVGLNSLP